MKAYKKRITNINCLFFLLFFTFISNEITFSQDQDEKQAIEPAKIALNNYIQHIITEANYSKYGFTSFAEVKKATLGKPLKMYIIKIDALKNYKPEQTLNSIIIYPKILWYPVMVDEATRIKMEMVYKDMRWIGGEFGNMKTTKLIADVMDSIPLLLKSTKQPYAINLLQISSLHATFLYITTSDSEFLIPAMFQPDSFGLENGVLYKAIDVLPKLSEYAQQIKEDEVM